MEFVKHACDHYSFMQTAYEDKLFSSQTTDVALMTGRKVVLTSDEINGRVKNEFFCISFSHPFFIQFHFSYIKHLLILILVSVTRFGELGWRC